MKRTFAFTLAALTLALWSGCSDGGGHRHVEQHRSREVHVYHERGSSHRGRVHSQEHHRQKEHHSGHESHHGGDHHGDHHGGHGGGHGKGGSHH